MNFKPLPPLGGSLDERLARSEKARAIKAQIEEERTKAPPEPVSDELTPPQVKHWRMILYARIGPWALIMPVSDIQRIRDGVQKAVNLAP